MDKSKMTTTTNTNTTGGTATPIDEDKIVNETWDEQEEVILKKWAEKALCYKLMHDRAHKRYWCLNSWFAIPCIIFSTVTGISGFAQDSFGDSYKYYIVYTMAGINILIAILQTISQYLTIAQKVEAHRVANISWDKFSRKIAIELSKDRQSRQNVGEFLANSQEIYDRMIENTPSLPQDTIRWFRKVIFDGIDSDDLKGCCLCFYQCCCFPCGMECCSNCLCRKQRKKLHSDAQINMSKRTRIELPAILGRIEPIKINNNSEPKNKYSIYESDI